MPVLGAGVRWPPSPGRPEQAVTSQGDTPSPSPGSTARSARRSPAPRWGSVKNQDNRCVAWGAMVLPFSTPSLVGLSNRVGVEWLRGAVPCGGSDSMSSQWGPARSIGDRGTIVGCGLGRKPPRRRAKWPGWGRESAARCGGAACRDTRLLDNGLAGFFGEGADRNRTDDGGFADLCLTTWLRRRGQQTYPCLWPSAIRSAGPRLRHRAPDRGPGARVKFRCRGPQSPTEPRCRRPETLPASHRGRGAGDGVTPAGPRPILRSCPRSPPPAAASP
jgi:hypothetical protein